MIDRPGALLFVSLTHKVITSEGCFQGAGSASGVNVFMFLAMASRAELPEDNNRLSSMFKHLR